MTRYSHTEWFPGQAEFPSPPFVAALGWVGFEAPSSRKATAQHAFSFSQTKNDAFEQPPFLVRTATTPAEDEKDCMPSLYSMDANVATFVAHIAASKSPGSRRQGLYHLIRTSEAATMYCTSNVIRSVRPLSPAILAPLTRSRGTSWSCTLRLLVSLPSTSGKRSALPSSRLST